MKKEFESIPENLESFNSYVEDFLKKINLKNSFMNSILISCEEVFLNICKHAYGEGEGKIFLDINLNMNKIIIEIRDFGIPFDPVFYVSKKANERKTIGGLGILLVKRLMDRVEYLRDGNMNILTMTKNIEG